MILKNTTNVGYSLEFLHTQNFSKALILKAVAEYNSWFALSLLWFLKKKKKSCSSVVLLCILLSRGLMSANYPTIVYFTLSLGLKF